MNWKDEKCGSIDLLHCGLLGSNKYNIKNSTNSRLQIRKLGNLYKYPHWWSSNNIGCPFSVVIFGIIFFKPEVLGHCGGTLSEKKRPLNSHEMNSQELESEVSKFFQKLKLKTSVPTKEPFFHPPPPSKAVQTSPKLMTGKHHKALALGFTIALMVQKSGYITSWGKGNWNPIVYRVLYISGG